jgi:hypothetical protein
VSGIWGEGYGGQKLGVRVVRDFQEFVMRARLIRVIKFSPVRVI